MIARQEELPAASYARIVTTLLPTSRGTVADHCVVPVAVPEPPVEVLHATAVTPTLSLAVPLTAMEAEEVATIVNPGETILSDGGVVFPLVGVGAGAGTGAGAGVGTGVGAGIGTTGVGTTGVGVTGVGVGVGTTGIGVTGVGATGCATAGPYSA